MTRNDLSFDSVATLECEFKLKIAKDRYDQLDQAAVKPFMTERDCAKDHMISIWS
jgi:hypothetical protein